MNSAVLAAEKSLPIIAPRRFAARTADVVLALILSNFSYPIGWLLAFAYLALGDRLSKGMLGNRIFRLRVVPVTGAGPLSRREAFFRNLPWLTVLTLFQVPVWGGWLVWFAIGGLAVIEGYLFSRYGVRDGLGNLMAEARVVDASVPTA